MAVAVEDQQLVAVARRQLLQAVEAEDVGVGEDAVVTPGHEQHRRVDLPCMLQVVVRQRRMLGLVRIHLHRRLAALDHLDDVAMVVEAGAAVEIAAAARSEEHTSELQSLMRTSYAVFCLKKKTKTKEETN